MFVTVDWSGATACSVLSSAIAENVQTILEPKVEDHSILVTDAKNLYMPWPRSLGVKREALGLSSGEPVRDVFRIQTVNRRPSALKDCLRRYGGVLNTYLGNSLRGFEHCELLNVLLGTCLSTAIRV